MLPFEANERMWDDKLIPQLESNGEPVTNFNLDFRRQIRIIGGEIQLKEDFWTLFEPWQKIFMTTIKATVVEIMR